VATTYRRPRSTRLLLIALVVTSLVTITVDFRGGERGPLAAIGRVGAGIVAPLQEGVSAVFRPIGSFVTNLFRAGSIAEENAQLRAQLDVFAADVQFRYALESQLRQLRELLGLQDELGYELMAATVIGGSFDQNFERTIQIDKGSADGVYVNMAVVTGRGLVGQVIKVTESTATVRLIIDHRSSVAVRLGISRELGTLGGQGEGDLRMNFVFADADIQLQEPVVTATYRLDGVEEGILPPDIPVGVVSRVVPDTTGVTGPEVYVRPAVDFSTLEIVALVRPGADEAADRQPGE
jgi:rod shape-determining protein MreC